jgi:hypothetical protein
MIIPMTFDLLTCTSTVEGGRGNQLIKVDGAKTITLRVEHGYYY